jgi:hypothetical protein
MLLKALEVNAYPDTIIPNYTAKYFAKEIIRLHGLLKIRRVYVTTDL